MNDNFKISDGFNLFGKGKGYLNSGLRWTVAENLMLEIRFNILNEHVDKFVIVEAKYSHSGEKKKLNFNINKFPEFRKKIIYLVSDSEPENLIYEKKNNILYEKVIDRRINSIRRIAYQSNFRFVIKRLF